MSTTNNRRSVSPASSAPYIDRPPIRMGFDPSQPGASPPVWPPIPVSNAPYIDPPPIRMGFGPSEPGPSPRILPPIRFRFQGGEFADTTRRSNAAVMPSLARPYGRTIASLPAPAQQMNCAMSPHQRLTASATLPERPQGAATTKTMSLRATGASRNYSGLPSSPSPLASRTKTITPSFSNRDSFKVQTPFLPNESTVSPQPTPVTPHARSLSGRLATVSGTASLVSEGSRPGMDAGPSQHAPQEHHGPPPNLQPVPEDPSDRARRVIGDFLRKKKKVSERGRP